ncbi:MAG: periplasmic heavy metal sensor [Bacteroidota bacterium]
MDIFAQNKLLIRIVIILAVLNVLSISVFVWKDVSPNPPPPPNDTNERKDIALILQKQLNLSETQTEQIRTLRSDFFQKEKELETIIRGERDSMNVAMFNKSINDTLILSLAKRVSENEYKMELLRFEQAKKFKTLCTPEQLEKFNDLVIEIRDYFKPEKEPKRK